MSRERRIWKKAWARVREDHERMRAIGDYDHRIEEAIGREKERITKALNRWVNRQWPISMRSLTPYDIAIDWQRRNVDRIRCRIAAMAENRRNE